MGDAAAPAWVFLIDGECTLCSAFGIAVNACDRFERIKYATQQSAYGAALSEACGADEWLGKSVLFVDVARKRYHTKSEAVLAAADVLDRWWLRPLVCVGRAIPRAWRDALYDAVSERRHAWFGTAPCRRPPARYRRCVLDA